MKFCSECAGPITVKVPEGDSHERFVCERCNRIFYRNPRVVVGTLPLWKNQVLLCRRAIEPRYGFWTLPSGFMENGETVEEGACRETMEEAQADVSIVRLFSVFSLPHVNQVYLTFLADLNAPEFAAGAESLEVKLFDLTEIPWSQIAFRAIEFALERLVESGTDTAEVHLGTYSRESGGRWIQAEKR